MALELDKMAPESSRVGVTPAQETAWSAPLKSMEVPTISEPVDEAAVAQEPAGLAAALVRLGQRLPARLVRVVRRWPRV